MKRLVRFYYQPQWAILLTILAIVVILGSACKTYSIAPQPSESQHTASVIHDLKAPKLVTPSSSSLISCVATSENDDALSYEWSATGGQIEGQSDSALWVAPDTTGDYTITVVVIDGKGNNSTGSVNITVTFEPNRPPVVDGVTCLDCREGIQTSRWREYHIKCDASDPEGSELNYTWSATIGEIEGEGSTASWLTFGEYGDAIIKVLVTDDKGNEAEWYLTIEISCCH